MLCDEPSLSARVLCLQDGPQDERPAADSIRCKGMGGTVEMRSTDFEGAASEQWQLLTVGLSDRHFLATVMTERRRLLPPTALLMLPPHTPPTHPHANCSRSRRT